MSKKENPILALMRMKGKLPFRGGGTKLRVLTRKEIIARIVDTCKAERCLKDNLSLIHSCEHEKERR
jgi:hypothetical protein